ncbi:FtsQ-type POTRA domain-containing protein [Clostridium carnis]
MDKKAKEFINKKKRKKALRRLVLWVFVLIIALVIFIYKASIFNVKDITINGVITLNKEEIQKNVEGFKGLNIFTLDYNEIEKSLLKNPYINKISIEKRGINKLNINITENKIAFYIKDGEAIKIINNNLVLVERVNTLEGRKLVEIIGLSNNNKGIGEVIVDDYKNTSKILNDFYPIIQEMPEEYFFSYIDLSDLTSIKASIGEVKIYLGDSENLVKKMNLVLNSIDQGVIKKGYINVSYDGPAVIKQEE